jgi:SAM-dependent methyltransferase
MQPSNWLATPLGRRCLSNEQRLVRRVLDRVFGEQLLQVGRWGPDDAFLRHARTQRVAVLDGPPELAAADVAGRLGGPPEAAAADGARRPGSPAIPAGVVSRLDQLAIVSDSIDAILLPHTLERTASPHAVLREAARVLRPEGCLIALGFLPTGFWGLRHLLDRGGYPPGSRHLIRERRLRDWLELLSFDVDRAQNYCHTLPFERIRRLGRLPRERWARRWLPMLAGAYLLVARKRAATLTPIRPAWQRSRLRAVGGLVEPTTRVSRHGSNG